MNGANPGYWVSTPKSGFNVLIYRLYLNSFLDIFFFCRMETRSCSSDQSDPIGAPQTLLNRFPKLQLDKARDCPGPMASYTVVPRFVSSWFCNLDYRGIYTTDNLYTVDNVCIHIYDDDIYNYIHVDIHTYIYIYIYY